MEIDDYARQAEAALRRGLGDQLSGPEQQSVEFAEAQVWATLAAAQAQRDANLIALADVTDHQGRPCYPALGRAAERLARDWEIELGQPAEPTLRPADAPARPTITPPPGSHAGTELRRRRYPQPGVDRGAGIAPGAS